MVLVAPVLVEIILVDRNVPFVILATNRIIVDLVQRIESTFLVVLFPAMRQMFARITVMWPEIKT